MQDDEIRVLVKRLGRAHPNGTVIERAAILAEGSNSAAVMTWIKAHGGTPEAAVAKSTRTGLYGSRLNSAGEADSRPPSRFVLPAGALDQ